jgi:hypothetical protein
MLRGSHCSSTQFILSYWREIAKKELRLLEDTGQQRLDRVAPCAFFHVGKGSETSRKQSQATDPGNELFGAVDHRPRVQPPRYTADAVRWYPGDENICRSSNDEHHTG